MSNILHVSFGGLRERKTAPLYQYDYGQVLRITGIDLPGAYEVHFSRTQNGEAKTQIGTEDGVLIPDEYLTASGTIYAWLYLHTGTDDGETEYVMQIPVLPRSRPVPDEPTPVEQSTITQAIAAINAAVERAETASDAAYDKANVSALNAEAYAVGTREGVDVASDDAAYHNNAKYYADSLASAEQTATAAAADAAASANAAGTSADAASASATAAAASETVATAAEDRAQTVLDSIPQDYQAISSSVGKMEDDIIGARYNLLDESRLLRAEGWTYQYDEENDYWYYTGTNGALTDEFKRSNGGFPIDFPYEENTQYTLSMDMYTGSAPSDMDGFRIYWFYTDDSSSNTTIDTGDIGSISPMARVKFTSQAGKTVSTFSISYSSGKNWIYRIKDVQLEAAASRTPYKPFRLTAVDTIARNTLDRLGAVVDRETGLAHFTWAQGTLKSADGTTATSETAIRTVDFTPRDNALALRFVIEADYSAMAFAYDGEGTLVRRTGIMQGTGTLALMSATQYKVRVWRPDGTATDPSTGNDTISVYHVTAKPGMPVTPQMFGAIGDGNADDTEAFQLALNSGYHEVFVPTSHCEKYKITGTLTIPKTCRRIYGEGLPRGSATYGSILFDLSGSGATIDTQRKTPLFDVGRTECVGIHGIIIKCKGGSSSTPTPDEGEADQDTSEDQDSGSTATRVGLFLDATSTYADKDINITDAWIANFYRVFDFRGRGLTVINSWITSCGYIGRFNWADGDDSNKNHPANMDQRAILFKNNRIHSITSEFIRVETGHAYGLTFQTNTVDNGRGKLITCLDEAWNWLIDGNEVQGMDGYTSSGSSWGAMIGFTGGAKNCLITNNLFSGDPSYWSSGKVPDTWVAIGQNATGCTITGNNFRNWNLRAVRLVNSNGCSITGNSFTNTITGAETAIRLEGECGCTAVTGNTLTAESTGSFLVRDGVFTDCEIGHNAYDGAGDALDYAFQAIDAPITIDPTTITEGTRFRVTDSTYISNAAAAAQFVSDFIPVRPNHIIEFNWHLSSNTYGHAFYADDKTHIVGTKAANATRTATVPQNAAYIRVTGTTANVDTYQMQLYTPAVKSILDKVAEMIANAQ